MSGSPFLRRLFFIIASTTVLCSPALAGHRQLIFFGDSLSDPGNYFIAFGQVSTPPYVPEPTAPYAFGGHHFSNGPTWAEDVSWMFHMPTSGMPALRVPRLFTNYAVGRARARPDAPVFSAYDLTTEVGLFLHDFHHDAPKRAIYVIWIGGLDVGDALEALATDPTGTESGAIIQRAVTAVSDGVLALWSAGARDFLILNVPDFGLIPAVRAAGPAAQQAATQLTAAYDGGLAQAAAGLSALPGIRLHQFDANALVHQIISNPSKYGLTDVQDSCLKFGVVVHPVCDHPNRYFFWDGIHPTRRGHEIFAELMLEENAFGGYGSGPN